MAAKVGEVLTPEKLSSVLAHPSCSKVKGLATYAIIDCRVEFSIVLIDRYGCRTTNTADSLVVKVSDLAVAIKNNRDGTYFVMFVPRTVEDVSISVSIAGQPFKGSPFPMACRDYKTINKPVKVVTVGSQFNKPLAIAFCNNDMWAVADCEMVHIYNAIDECIKSFECPDDKKLFSLSPAALTFSKSNCLYVLGAERCVVQKFAVDGKFLLEFQHPILYPSSIDSTCMPSILAHNGKIYATDLESEDPQIVVFEEDGKICSIVKATCPHPAGLAISSCGNLLMTDNGGHCIHTISVKANETLKKFGKKGYAVGELSAPIGIATDAYGFILVCENVNDRVSVFDKDGNFVHCFGGRKVGHGFISPWRIAISPGGKIYVIDHYSTRVQIYF